MSRGLIGAGRYERSGERSTWRNGYRERTLDTRLGSLRIPKLRQGSYFPPFLEARKSSEKALVAVIQEAWIGGVSTRRVDDLVQAMGLSGISKSQVSKLCREIDERVHGWRSQSLFFRASAEPEATDIQHAKRRLNPFFFRTSAERKTCAKRKAIPGSHHRNGAARHRDERRASGRRQWPHQHLPACRRFGDRRIGAGGTGAVHRCWQRFVRDGELRRRRPARWASLGLS
jgi:hypothetical protein